VNGYQQQVVRKKVDTYLGIPFAQPPTGNLRFRPPQPLPPPDDTTVYNATELPASCYQTIDVEFNSSLVDMWNPNTNMSEDCLYLNIWQPQAASDSAVLVRLYFLMMMMMNRKSVVAIKRLQMYALSCRCNRLAERHMSVLTHRPMCVHLFSEIPAAK